MSEQTLSLVAAIRRRLRTTLQQIGAAELLFGLVLTVGIVSGLWFFLVAMEAGLWLETAARSVVFWTVAVVLIGLFVYFLLLPALRLGGVLPGPSEEAVARRIGDHHPEVSDRLVNLLQLVEGRGSEAPDPMVDGAVRMLSEQVQGVDFSDVADYNRARRAARMAALPLAALAVFLLAAPSTFLDASKRLLTPGTHYQRPAPYQLVVEPGSLEVARGASLDIVVRARGAQLPRAVVLAVNNLEEDHVEEITLTADSMGVYRHQIVNVRRSLRYRVSAEPVRTEWYKATVTERPLVRGLQVSLAFPAYTGIPPQRLEPNVGDVTALPGTRVSVEVGLGGQAVEAAFLLFGDGRRDTLALDGLSASGHFTLRREGQYQVRLRNAAGLENSEPITYSLRLLQDAPPGIILLAPETDAAVPEGRPVGLHMRLNDDFGFSGLRLNYRLAESRFGQVSETFKVLPLPLAAPRQLDQEVWFDWALRQATDLDPVPGDVIEYYVEVRDNDAVGGFKAARSATHRLRVPSLADQYEQLERQQDQTESQLENMLQQTETIEDQFRELRDDLRRKQEADWEDKRQLEQLQQRQQQLENQVEQLSREMDSMTEQMKEQNLISEETAQMYQELKKAIEEVNSPELQDALRKLQEAMENLNLPQMQESIQNFEFNEEQYKQRLERALELFKKVRTQQKLDEASKLAEALAQQEEKLRQETEKLQQQVEKKQQDDPRNQQNRQAEEQKGSKEDEARTPEEQQRRAQELSKEQERAREEMKRLQEKLDELREEMKDLKSAPKDAMQDVSEKMRDQKLPERMKENSEQLKEMKLDEAKQGQQQMQNDLENLQQQLQKMQQNMQGQQLKINMAGLRRALGDVLSLSQRQERLRAGIRNNASDQTSLRDDARRQVELTEGLNTVTDSLQALSREIPQMSREVQRHAGESLRAMSQSVEAMTERAVGEVSGHQKTSMTHLNELALLLSDLLNQLMNMQQGSGDGSGQMSMQQMLQQMQQMAQEQQQLNDQMQQFLNDLQGNRLSQDQQQRLEQMRNAQESIQRQLKQLNRNPAARGKMLGDLNKIAEQMEESIQELQRRQVDQRTIDRQQQILQRLLDAQKSLRERGEEKKREGREGRDVPRDSPGPLTPAEEAEKLRRDLIRALESGYTPDFEELIKRYFELLQQQVPERR